MSLLLIVILPVPGTRYTLATDFFLLPVLYVYFLLLNFLYHLLRSSADSICPFNILWRSLKAKLARKPAEGKTLLVDTEVRVFTGLGSDADRASFLKVGEGIELGIGILYYRCQ